MIPGNAVVLGMYVLLAVASCGATIHAGESPAASGKTLDWAALNDRAAQDYLQPVRPGVPGKDPFWNIYSRQFTYVPAFDFPINDKAVSYHFECKDLAGNKNYSCNLTHPWDPITPLWMQLPAAAIEMTVQAVDADGTAIQEIGKRIYCRRASFHGPYHERNKSYTECGLQELRFLYHLPCVQELGKTGVADPKFYDYFCYPSKMLAAIVCGLCDYAKRSPADRDSALQIARRAADYLIKTSVPAGNKLEYLPLTYAGDNAFAKGRNDNIMMSYSFDVALAYLDLYDAVNDEKYLKTACRIVETFCRLQLPEGSWYYIYDFKKEEPVSKNICIPDSYLNLIDRLELHGEKAGCVSRNRALSWILNNPVKTFNWEGQFEDVLPTPPYRNLSKGQACGVACYLLDHRKQDPSYLNVANEIARYAEDQFVLWAPCALPKAMVKQFEANVLPGSLLPCAQEQYGWMKPINASASDLIVVWLKLYEATGDRLYLAKAVSMGNCMTLTQRDNGQLPTYWMNEGKGNDDNWLNCEVFAAITILKLADVWDK